MEKKTRKELREERKKRKEIRAEIIRRLGDEGKQYEGYVDVFDIELRNSRIRSGLGLLLIVVSIAGLALWSWSCIKEQREREAQVDTSNYEGVMKAYYNALVSGDGQAMSQIMAPDEYWVYYLEEYDKTEDDVIAAFEESSQSVMDQWKETYGSDVMLSYQIVGMSSPAQEGLDEWNENMESLLGNTSATITAAVTLQVEQNLSGSLDSGVEIVYPTLAKMGDSWYILETDNEELQGDSE